MTEEQMKNKELVKEYPFIRANNYWTMKRLPKEEDDYSWTLLDDMPKGWKKAFGLDLCREIKEALLLEEDVKNFDGDIVPALDDYRVLQVKEKFGCLRWYDDWTTPEIQNIKKKYAKLSVNTCCNCGKPATKISNGWICPWCDECAKEINDTFVDIE